MILKGALEDMLHYALLYTPSWNKVAKEKVISAVVISDWQRTMNRYPVLTAPPDICERPRSF